MGKAKEVALSYYSRNDVRKALLDFGKNREVVGSFSMEGFSKRPDILEYENEVLNLVKKGVTSFHCSEELWENPLEISTELDEEQMNKLRIGWDLLIDIDSKYLDYSKVLAKLLIKAFEYHGIKNIGIKFSGSKGFHLIIPWRAFPEEINEVKTKDMFPEWPRAICSYLNELIRKNLQEEIAKLEHKTSYKILDKDAEKQVMPDIVLVSPRHLFRMPYSLHDISGLASIVIDKRKIDEFKPRDANPLKVKVRKFYPEAEKEEARELLLQALDYYKEKKTEKSKKKYENVKIKDLSPDLYPPCVNNILKGLADGRKRALFILMNFFRSLGQEWEEIEKRIEEWNKKNKKPLKQGYIKSQFNWAKRNKQILPPNCDKDHYKGIGVCFRDNFCKFIKNPVNYTVKKSRFLERKSKK